MNNLSQHILSIYRGWRDFEQSRSEIERATFVLVDDLAEQRTSKLFFNSEKDVESALRGVLSSLKKPTDQWPSAIRDYTKTKIQNSICFLRNELNTSSLGLKKRGVVWQPISLQYLSKKYHRAGLHHQDLQFRSYLEKPIGNSRVAEQLRRRATEITKLLSKQGPLWSFPNFEIKEVQYDRHWRCIVTFINSQFVLWVNTFPTQKYTKALIDAYVLHEICGHMVHFNHLKKSKELQGDFPHLLALSVPTLDSFYAEFTGEFLARRAAQALSSIYPDLPMALEYFEALHCTRYWGLSKLSKNPKKVDEISEHHAKQLGGDVSHYKSGYSILLSNPFLFSQAMTYYPGIKLLDTPSWQRLSSEDTFSIFAILSQQFLKPSAIMNLLK